MAGISALYFLKQSIHFFNLPEILDIEAAMGYSDTQYTQNLLFMFATSVAAVFILSLHSFLQNVPLLFVIIGQYLL